MTASDEHIGQRVAALRGQAGLSQKELATRLQERGVVGLYGSTIAKIELGQRALKLREAAEFSEMLNLRLEDLTKVAGTPANTRMAIHNGRMALRDINTHLVDGIEQAIQKASDLHNETLEDWSNYFDYQAVEGKDVEPDVEHSFGELWDSIARKQSLWRRFLVEGESTHGERPEAE